MKFIIISLCLLSSVLYAQDEGIFVSGKARLEVQADIMNWSLRVSTAGNDLQQVASDQLTQMNAVSAMLIAAGIEPKDLEVTDMSFGERYSYEHRERVKDGYTATSRVTFALKNFELYQKIWMDLAAFDAVAVQHIDFDHSDKIALRNKARLQAIEAAKEKARKMAEALDVRLGKPLSLSEIQAPWNSMNNFMGNRLSNVNVAMANAESTPGQGVSFGKMPIEATVQVRFAIRD